MARAMMKVQMEHALARLSEAYEKILGKPPKCAHNGAKGRADLMRSGTVTVTPAMVKRALRAFDRNVSRNDRWCTDIDEFIQRELKDALNKAYKPKPDKVMAAYEARRTKLNKKYNEAKDEIILGDVDRALKLIAEFSKTKV